MRGTILMAVSAAGSVLAHIAVFTVLTFSVTPDTRPTQPSPPALLTIDTYLVDQQEAQAKPTAGDIASANAPRGTAIDAGAIARLHLTPQRTPGQAVSAASVPLTPLLPRTAIGNSLKSSAPATIIVSEPEQLDATSLDQSKPALEPISALPTSPTKLVTITALATASPTSPVLGSRVQSSSPKGDALPTQQLAALAMLATPAWDFGDRTVTDPASLAVIIVSEPEQLDAISLDQSKPALEPISALPTSPTKLVTITALATASPTSPVLGSRVHSSSPKGDALPTEQLAALAMLATPAWDFGDHTVTDPTSLAVIQAFMAPGDLAQSDANAGQVRDGLTATLADVDCARLTATFIPQTGALELRGHVPDYAARAQVIAALQSQIGDGITVTDNLLHLPSPQCGVLTGIADIGLPQSTDQNTNSRLVGENAHAREYGFVEGQRLSFDLTAPDYDAVVYVDYFDAAGQVIHLVPNETVPLTLHSAKTIFGIGIDNRDQRGLNITIGPPFGQEITVAFAVSVPLFEVLRPLVEPADPYLKSLKIRVAKARAVNSDFKGEWVYFFVSTAPASQ